MKMERLSRDKIRIFLTFDDLVERGIQKDDMWREIPKVHELFSEMMDQAYSELGFEASGPLAVEVFGLPAQGMIVIVTRGKVHPEHLREGYDDEEEVYELELTLEQNDTITYMFSDFEDLIRAVRAVRSTGFDEGSLISYKDKWYLQILNEQLDDKKSNAIIAILSEYGDTSSVTRAMLEEYGKMIISNEAIKVINESFR